MSHFSIKCRNCGMKLKEVYCAFCEHCRDSLLVSEYKEIHLREGDTNGVWRFNWLPLHSPLLSQAGPVVYRSEGLSERLGLKNLYIAFNGYWPEIGAEIETCTFKEFEAAVVLQNAKENNINGLIVASAGNTARAFAHLSTKTGYPVIIVVPRMCLPDIWYTEGSSSVPTVCIRDGDYSDSIDVARRIAATLGIPFEGGVKNIAKRDGLGIVLLEAVSSIGMLPDHYFQAVGSGTGAIATWEMAERFLRDGRFGNRLPVLHLAQNLPFAPMVKAWERKSRDLSPEDLRSELVGLITTRVLSNRYPAYSIKGGVYDALTATGGITYGIENDAVFSAIKIFEETEGIDIVPAAGVAVAALMDAVEKDTVKRDDTILINITGGGEKRLQREKRTYRIEPLIITKTITEKDIEELLCNALKIN